MRDTRPLRIGFWLGDTSLSNGGTDSYAWRTLAVLLKGAPPDCTFVVACHAEAGARLAVLAHDARARVETRLIPRSPAGLSRLRRALITDGASDGAVSGGAVIERPASTVARLLRAARRTHLRRWIESLGLDLLHCPAQSPPVINLDAPCVVTMHDVQELHFPEYFTPAQRAQRAVDYWRALDGARAVVVSYEHVKRDLIKYFGLSAEKVHVCPISLDSVSLAEPTEATKRSCEEKYAGQRPYLLYPAQTWRHKNHARLLEALSNARERGAGDLRLICTGVKSDYYYAEIEGRVAALGLGDAVLFTGIVPEDELCWLYRHAALVTIPTEYEAGSYPLLEAMTQRAPVVCSNVTSLPETIDDARFVFDPYDADALAELILRMTTDADLREENRANSDEQLKRLRRVDSGTAFYEMYRRALSVGDAVS
jgi:glycosyltransferase involved in cell wall biosynthesis